jgi:hypothetical protein
VLAVALSRKIGAEQFGIFSTTSTHAVVERPSLDHLLGTSEQRDWNVTPSALFILMTDTCRVTRALTTASPRGRPGEIVARPAVEPHRLALLPGDDPEAVMLDFM